MPLLVQIQFECALVVASHGYILGAHVNEGTLLNNVMPMQQTIGKHCLLWVACDDYFMIRLLRVATNRVSFIKYGLPYGLYRFRLRRRNGAIWLATKYVLHQPGFTLWPRLLQWRTSRIDGKLTWLLTWPHFLLEEFSKGQVSHTTSNPWTRNLTFRELQLEAFFLNLVYVLSASNNHILN